MRVLGKEHKETMFSVLNRAVVLSHTGNSSEAKRLHKENLDICKKYSRNSALDDDDSYHE